MKPVIYSYWDLVFSLDKSRKTEYTFSKAALPNYTFRSARNTLYLWRSMIATSHMWLLNPRNVVNITSELYFFKFPFNITSHTKLVFTRLCSTTLWHDPA